jgi:U3 small nucleolar RNA-associated protein 14
MTAIPLHFTAEFVDTAKGNGVVVKMNDAVIHTTLVSDHLSNESEEDKRKIVEFLAVKYFRRIGKDYGYH